MDKVIFILWTETNRLLAKESAGNVTQKSFTETKFHSHFLCVGDAKQLAFHAMEE